MNQRDNAHQARLSFSQQPEPSKKDYIFHLLQRRDPQLFMEGGCHIFARALRRKFGYAVYGIRKAKGKLSHIYCLGQRSAVDFKGKRLETDILWDYQDYPGHFCCAYSLQTRIPLPVDILTKTDYEAYGLLFEPTFEAAGMQFAEDYIAEHELLYANA